MPEVETACSPIQYTPSVTRKRLGQFFTGPLLARLLAALSKAEQAASAIDPMSGSGDLLRAVHELNPKATLSGIEIDRTILEQAEACLDIPHLTLVRGNAFSFKDLHLALKNFDLVIANPPYVRYQTFSGANSNADVPNASQVRHDLLENVNVLLQDKEDRRLFREIILAYSGLSDLAVPAWILTAMLTKVGGSLALVLPESWLSRDYAQVVQYILLRWFKIKYVVEDSNASWFSDALVKTTLLVAERVERRLSAFSWQGESYAHVKIFADAANSRSVVGNVYPRTLGPEKKFTEELESLLLNGKSKKNHFWSAELFRVSELASNLRISIGANQWIKKVNDFQNSVSDQVSLPVQLRRLLADSKGGLKTLDQIGIMVGQGLRTGANPFFYVDIVKNGKPDSIVAPNKVLSTETASVPIEFMLPVLRRQSELPPGFALKKSNLKGRVLTIFCQNKISGDLARLIHKAEGTKVGDKLIPDLSAVKTNAKANTPWYFLPKLTPRHVPQLLIPRINGNVPRTYLNNQKVVVDANFSTIWLKPNSSLTPAVALALLNSSWCIAVMELSGAVMGGGALKLEATHIKRIPFPALEPSLIKKLDGLGQKLAQSGNSSILRRINQLVMGALFEKNLLSQKLEQVDILIQQRLHERTKRR